MPGRRLLIVVPLLLLWPAAAQARGCLSPAERKEATRFTEWNVCIKASRKSATLGQKVTLTAETNGVMSRGERRLLIVDVTEKNVLEVCAGEQVCTIEHPGIHGGLHKYTASVDGLRGGTPVAKPPAKVTWQEFDLELSAYAKGRGPDKKYPAKLCDPEGCGTNTADLGHGINFFVKASRPIPRGLEMQLEDGVEDPKEPQWVWRPHNLEPCWLRDDGCRSPAESGDESSADHTHHYAAALYFKDGNNTTGPKGNRVTVSNELNIVWRDWTPLTMFDPGERLCDSEGKHCYHHDVTLRAEVKQPLDPGVVILLYFAKGCLPKPGDPEGDPGCSAYSPKDCSPPSQVCTYTGDVLVGYQPLAMVVYSGPRPMLDYGHVFRPALQ